MFTTQDLSLTLGEFAKKTYNQNKSNLQENYPGITSNRIMQELDALKGSAALATRLSHFTDNKKIINFFADLDKGIPLEYIRRECFFYKLPFFVDESVHIPKFETEILVEMATDKIKSFSKKHLKIADIGVGCGNILFSILGDLNLPNDFSVDAIACDISMDALRVAQKNYFRLKPHLHGNCSVCFLKSDRMLDFNREIDIIVSNPPYIRRREQSIVHRQVDANEPHSALYLEDEVYDNWFYRLFIHVKGLLSKDGIFIMEGSERHLPRLADLAKELGFIKIEIKQDYNSLDRFLILH